MPCTNDDFWDLVEQLPEVTPVEGPTYTALKVRGKGFGYHWPATSTAGLKQERLEQIALVAERPEVFETQFVAGQFGWVVVRLDRIERDELAELVFEAWRLTAPKRLHPVSGALPLRMGAWLGALLLGSGLLLVGSTPVAEAASKPTSVTLSPTADPAHSQTFTWRMTKNRSGQVVQVKAPDGRVTTAGAHYKMRVQKKYSGANAHAFTATVTKLAPATRYRYRIVTSGGSTRWTTFTTARVGLDRSWTFLAFGDTQVANTGVPEDIIDTAVARHPSAPLLLHAGDVVNKPNSQTQWRQFMSATYPTRTSKNWLISVGNHEQCVLVTVCRSGDAQAFRSYYSWPRNGYPGQGATWYYTDYQGVRFIVLDTFGGDLDRQAAFLETALETNRQRWTVVLQHAGPFASRADRDHGAERSTFLPLYEKYQVDLVLAGHDHSYDRGYHGSHPNSTVYAVSVSGKKFYTASGEDWARGGAHRVVSASRTATYQTVTVSQNQLVYQAIVGYKGKGATTSKKVGQVLDQVTIAKNGTTKTVR